MLEENDLPISQSGVTVLAVSLQHISECVRSTEVTFDGDPVDSRLNLEC